MEKEFKKILTMIGEDPNRDGLKDTPKRASEALKFLTRGMRCVKKRCSMTRFLIAIMKKWLL